MRRRHLIIVVAASVLLTACAPRTANYRPIVDTPNRAAYEADLADCREIAIEGVRPSPSRAARLGFLSTTFGALVGLAIGADVGDTGAAIAGAAIGAGIGAASSQDRRQREVNRRRARVVANCMEGRGYDVLG